MAHFQLIDNPLLLKRSWLFSKGTRLFVHGDSGEEKITIQLDQEIQLEQSGTIKTSAGDVLPTIFSTDRTVVDVVKSVPFDKLEKQTVTLKAKGAGKAELKGRDPSGNVSADLDPLKVVVGDFQIQTGIKIDLLADVCRGSEPAKIHAIHRMLNNNQDNIFNENSDANKDHFGPRACGSVAETGASVIWGGNAGDHQFVNYHTAFRPSARVTERKDVKFDEATTKRGRTALARWLKTKKAPVEVGVLYGPTPHPPSSLDMGEPSRSTGTARSSGREAPAIPYSSSAATRPRNSSSIRPTLYSARPGLARIVDGCT